MNNCFTCYLLSLKDCLDPINCEKMKTYVLTISENFPKTHKKAGTPTNFPLSIKHYDKIHTIRGNYFLWRKRFEQIEAGKACLSVRVWEGKPYNSKQQEIFRYDKTKGIGMQRLEFYEDKDGACAIRYPLVDNYSEPDIETLAENDGLSYPDFKEWFKGYDLSEPMVIIHFTDFRY